MAHDKVKTINQAHFRIKAHCDIPGDTKLRSLWIEIPDYCHLQCPYCFANTCRNNPHLAKDNLKVDEYLRLLNDFKESEGQFLGIPGNGEPFHPSNRDLVMRILRHANSLGLRTTVFTTGETLFWEMRSDRTYAENVREVPNFAIMEELVGLDVILLIKCNSLNRDVQDSLVAQPGYTDARTMAMQWLMEKYSLNSDKENRRLGIVTSIMPENQDEIVDLYRYAETNNLIFDCDTILPQGRGQSFIKPGHSLSDQECRAIYQTLDSISEEHLSTGGSYVGVACDRIKHHLYIDICGNAYTCIGCVGRGQDLVLGNIRKQSLVEIWNNTIRVQMRDNLDKIVLGACSYCKNFQVSCWTCLGRSVERFEFKDDKIILHTRGCFNHQPDWNRWLLQCDRLTRTRLSEVPPEIRLQVRERIHEKGLEIFWQELPEEMIEDSITRHIPLERKDICFSDLNFPTRSVWDFTRVQPIENINHEYLKALGTLLPRVLLCSLKQISEWGITEGRDKAFVSLNGSEGTVQFINLMFYIPHKKRYMYRTIVQNSLDPGVLDLDEYRNYTREHSEDREEIIQELRIRSRMGRLWQRWAETLRNGDRAPILDHIKNLSQKLEDENIETYELILTEKLYRQERIWIHTDVVHNELNILAIFPLLDMPMIKNKVSAMHKIVRNIAVDEEAWKEIYSIMADHVFVDSWESKGKELNVINAAYQNLAKIGFYPTKSSELQQNDRETMEAELQKALSEILRVNLHLFPDSSESDWFKGQLASSFLASDWVEFFSVLGGSSQGYRTKNRHNKILPGFLNLSEVADINVLIERTYNPLLIQIVRLFIDERGGQGLFCEDWLMAVNYFIWLSFFREYLDIQTYFVHHAHNLQRHLSAFLGEQGDKKGYPTPSGIIVCAHERLSLGARRDYRQVFTQVMNPLEALIQAEFLTTDLATSESQLKNHAQKAAISQVMARNTSHNIGSHVMNKLAGDLSKIKIEEYNYKSDITLDVIHKENIEGIDDLEVKNNTILFEQLAIFNNYVKCRMDYLSDITYGAPLMQTSKYAKEIFEDFDKVRLLLGNISGLTEFEYKIRFEPFNKLNDILLAMPNDVLGCQALYNIIENVIRNTAKHRDEGELPTDDIVTFTVEFNEVQSEGINISNERNNDLYKLYEVTIYDNLSKFYKAKIDANEKERYRDSVFGLRDKQADISQIAYLAWKQNSNINKSLLNENNTLRALNLGLIEMEASACYLRKLDLESLEDCKYHVELRNEYKDKLYNSSNNLNILKAVSIKNKYLGYRFFVLKPTEVLFVSDDDVNNLLTEEHIRGGIKLIGITDFSEMLLKGIVFNHQFVIYSDDCVAWIIKKFKTALPLRCFKHNIFELLNNRDHESVLCAVWIAWGKSIKGDNLSLEIFNAFPHLTNNNQYKLVLFDHMGNKQLRENTKTKVINYINTNNYSKPTEIFFECLSSIAQEKLPHPRSLRELPFKEYVRSLIVNSEQFKDLYVQFFEATAVKTLIIDERIQNALVEDFIGVKYNDLYRSINILVPDKSGINLSGNIITKEDFTKLLFRYKNELTIDDFLVIHYSILERVFENNKKKIDIILRCMARRCNVVVTSGRGTPAGLPIEVRFIHLSCFLNALLGVRSKHYINYVLHSSRKSNKI